MPSLEGGSRTETKHYVEKYDQDESNGIDCKACRAHPEWALWNVLPPCEKVRANGEGV